MILMIANLDLISYYTSASLSIPAPPNEVPQTNTSTQPSVTSLKVPAKLKKSKVLELSKTLMTARYLLVFSFLIPRPYLFLFRNLYAIFYKKTHPDVTEAEFREIYKGLDKETIKVRTYFPQQHHAYWLSYTEIRSTKQADESSIRKDSRSRNSRRFR